MKITIVVGDGRHVATLPYAHAAHAEIVACPHCGDAPGKVAGSGVTHHDHDTYYARGAMLCCGATVAIETKTETIFGIDEDERVLHGRCRVY